MGTFSITEKLSHPTKFACNVSFNGNPAEYHELDTLDPALINAELQATADDAEVRATAEAEASKTAEGLTLQDGKLVE